MPGRRPTRTNQRKPKRSVKTESVFLNIPYDDDFENLLLAYIAGISAFGFIPRATLEIPFGQRRVEKILELIEQSEYSIHDLSRVQLDRNAPRTPRFNMPFELGLTIGMRNENHSWVVCETLKRRLNKSLSDLDGTDVYIHDGTVRGVFRELANAFIRSDRQPTVLQMLQIYRVLRAGFRDTLKGAGAKDPFNARVFRDLSVIASVAADEIVLVETG